MRRHCDTNNRAPRWTFTDPYKPEVRPGAREESASPAWLSAPAMNARDTTEVYTWRLDTGCGPTIRWSWAKRDTCFSNIGSIAVDGTCDSQTCNIILVQLYFTQGGLDIRCVLTMSTNVNFTPSIRRDANRGRHPQHSSAQLSSEWDGRNKLAAELIVMIERLLYELIPAFADLKPTNQHIRVWVWVYWCFTSHATIFQSYMWRHRCASGLKKLYLRSGS